jgi:hypothetical protein
MVQQNFQTEVHAAKSRKKERRKEKAELTGMSATQ